VLFTFYIVACIANAVVTIVAFFLYVKARLAYQDKKEKKYQSLHFITLLFFVLFGVLILIHLSNRLNGVMQR
jgi:cytochrome bd-type quinol oxidase subunit 2